MKDDDSRIDIFLKQVGKMLRLTRGIIKRAKLYQSYGKLDVYKAIEIALQTIPSSGLLAPSTQALNGKKNSSGGCSMQASASPDFFSVFFILVNLCGWRVIRFRFSRKQKLKYHNIN